MGVDYEFVLELAEKIWKDGKFSENLIYILYSLVLPKGLWWSLKSQLNPHLTQLGISSLYILKLMENSAAMCDNYQPAQEDRVARKGRMGGGGEVSRRRRERLKWEEDGHMKSLEKKSSFSLVSLVGTPFSLPFLGYLLCGVLAASSRYVGPPPSPTATPPPPQDRHPWRAPLGPPGGESRI